MLLQFRQGLVRHQIDIAGTANFVRKAGNGENIDLICDNAPFIFTIAHSASDYLIEINQTYPNAWTGLTPLGQTQYLYIDVSLLDASLSFGYTLLFPYHGPSAPVNPAQDQHWFDTTTKLHKVWNGTKWIVKLRIFVATYDSSAILNSRPVGTQVGLDTQCYAGNIVFSMENVPLNSGAGTFITTESGLLAKHTSAEPLKLEALQCYAAALEYIPKFSLVTFAEFKKVRLAGLADTVNGMMIEEQFPGEIGNIVTSGIVRNEQWNFLPTDVNKSLYIAPNGTFSFTQANNQTYQIGYVYDVDAIMIKLHQITDVAAVVASNTVVAGPGIAVAQNGTLTTVALQSLGLPVGPIGLSSVQTTPFSINQYGQITSLGTPTLITPDWTSILNTPTTVQGYGITNAVISNPLIAPGTFPKITYDAKGLVTAGEALIASDIPNLDWSIITSGLPTSLAGYGIIDAQPLSVDLTAIAAQPNSAGILAKTSTGNWFLDTTQYLSALPTINITGDVAGSGTTDIPVALTTTGIVAGTYTKLTVDAKGRAFVGQNPSTLAGYGITDTYTKAQTDAFLANKADINHSHTLTGTGHNGITVAVLGYDISVTLDNTGVIPGTYNNVTIDSTGRVIGATNTLDNDAVTLIGDITGNGTGIINTTLVNSGVNPGVYNVVNVNAKGLITSASMQTTLAGVGITDAYTVTQVDNFLATKAAIDHTHSLVPTAGAGVTLNVSPNGTGYDISANLDPSGVIPGTYNQVTVNAAGQVIVGNNSVDNDTVTLTGDVTGSGTGTFATTLSDTGVAPGTYNSVTVDSKGRVINASNTTDIDTDLLISGYGQSMGYQVDWPTAKLKFSSSFATEMSNYYIGITKATVDIDLRDIGITAGSYFGFTVDAKGRLTDAWNPLPTPITANTLLSWNGTTYQWVQDLDIAAPVTSVNGAIGDVIVNSIYQGNSAVTVLDSTIGSVTTVIDGLTTSTYLANTATIGYDTSSPIWLNSYKFSAANSIFSVTQYGVSFVVDPQGNSYQLINTTSEGTPGQILVKYNAKGVLQWSKTVTQYLRFGDTWPLKVFYSTVINRVLLPVSVRTNRGLYINELLILDPESGTQSYLALALPGDNTSNTFPPPFNLRDIDYIEDPSANISSPGYFLLSYIENGISRIAKLNFVTNNPWYYTFTVESVINVSTFVAQKVKFDSTKHFYTAIGDASDAGQNFVGACIIKYDPALQTEVFQTVLPITDFPSGQMLLDFCYDNNDDIYVTAYTNGTPQFWIFKISGTNGSVIWQKLISDSSVGATTALSPEAILFDGSRIIVRYQLYPDASGYFDPRLLALNINGTIAYHYNIIGLPTDHFLPSNICYYHNQYLYLGGNSKIFKYPSDGSLTGDHTTTIGVNIAVNTTATITDSTIITSNNQFNLLVQDPLYQIIYSDPFTDFVISNISPWEYTFALSPLSSNVYNVVLNSTINDGTSTGIYGQVLTSNGNGSPPSWKTPIYDVQVDGTTILMSSTGLSLAPINQPSGPYYTVNIDSFGRVVGGNTTPIGVNWVDIFSTPTTLAGYGITDAYNITAINALTWNWTSITSTPTTLIGYGITDAYTKTEVDALVAGTGGGGGTFTGGTVTSPIVLSNTVVHEQFANIDPTSGNFYGTSTNYITIDTATGSVFWIDVTTDMGFMFTNAAPFGQVTSFILELRCNAAHSVNFAVTQTVNWASGTAPTLTTNGIGYDTLAFYTHDGGSTWRGLVLGQDMK